MTGEIGDVYLLHPLMVHSASKNVMRTLRVITNPPVSLKAPFQFNRNAGEDYSLVEQKTLRELGFPTGLKGRKIRGEREWIVPRRIRIQAEMKERERERLENEGAQISNGLMNIESLITQPVREMRAPTCQFGHLPIELWPQKTVVVVPTQSFDVIWGSARCDGGNYTGKAVWREQPREENFQATNRMGELKGIRKKGREYLRVDDATQTEVGDVGNSGGVQTRQQASDKGVVAIERRRIGRVMAFAVANMILGNAAALDLANEIEL
ncbi:hypothetical protein C8R47DRAFT_1270074 [Mycena vitilis]|nr:hypothetical protein C8R47DRAFT_1270074 [Mycena vitilis]